jgi:UDP-glucose 4-epimerase
MRGAARGRRADRAALILGHTSFIGRALGAELARRGLRVSGASSRELDLTSRDSAAALARLYGPDDAVVLLSRVSRSLPVLDQFEGDLAVAANVARALSARKPGLLVFASSTAVYGTSRTRLRLTEEAAVAPETPYAAAKYACERLLAHAAAQSGTPLLILRPCMVYGPGDASGAYGPSLFLRSAREEGIVRLFGDGAERRDYLHVDDLAWAAAELMSRRASGLFNVGSGRTHSFAELAAQLERLYGSALRVARQPRRVPKADQSLSLAKLRRAAPRFSPRSLAEGLRDCWRAARS